MTYVWALVFGAVAVALLGLGWKAGNALGYYILAGLAALYALSAMIGIPLWVPFIFVLLAFGWFYIQVRKYQGKNVWAPLAAFGAAGMVLAGLVLASPQSSTPDAHVSTRVVSLIGDLSNDQPLLAGSAAVTAETPVTIDCGRQADGTYLPIVSWQQLVTCINNAPADKRAAYIAAANARENLGLSWADIVGYAQIEELYGVDTRVILAINTQASDEEIRKNAQQVAGDAAAKLSIVRLSGYLVNSSDFHDGGIADIADGRSQIRILLTPPLKTGESYSSNLPAAENGIGVLVECLNFSSGIKKTPPTVVTQPETKTTPATTTPTTTTPTTSTPPTSTTPTTTTPTTSTPPTSTTPTTTTPTTSTPPPPVCEWNPELPPDDEKCLEPKDEDNDIDQPDGITPAASPSGSPEAEDTMPVTDPDFTEEAPGDSTTITAPGADPVESTSVGTTSAAPVDVTDAPSSDDPGTEIVDPDAASAAAGLMFLGFGAFKMRRKAQHV